MQIERIILRIDLECHSSLHFGRAVLSTHILFISITLIIIIIIINNIFYLSKHSYFSRCSNSANSLCNHSDIFNVNKISTATFTEIKFLNTITCWHIFKLCSAELDILVKQMFSDWVSQSHYMYISRNT